MMKKTDNTTVRDGESNDALASHPERSSRFFKLKSYWYFRTREGMDIGPFDRKMDAMEGASGFLSFLREAQQDVVTRITKYIKHQPRSNELTNPNINGDDVMSRRTERLFPQSGYWYFRTREGMDIGPFDDRGEASLGAKGFVSFLEDAQPEVVNKVTRYIRAA